MMPPFAAAALPHEGAASRNAFRTQFHIEGTSMAMSRLIVTTVCRNTAPDEPSGYVYTVDPDTREVTGKCPIIEPPLTHADPNPRGGMRGAKGISFSADTIFIANHSSVFEFDSQWRLLREITHPSSAGIHDVLFREGALWVTSSRNDIVFEMDLNGGIKRHINLRTLRNVCAELAWKEPNRLSDDAIRKGTIDFRDPRSHKYEKYDGVHVNSVAFLPQGDLLIMMGLLWSRGQTGLFTLKKYLKKYKLWQPLVWASCLLALFLPGEKKAMNTEMAVNLAKGKSAVVRLDRDGGARVVFVVADTNTPVHSLLVEEDGKVLFDDTSAGEIVRFDPDTGETLMRLKATDKFLRGICKLKAGNRVAVGSREDLLLVDLAEGRVEATITLTANPDEAVYDVHLLPDAFAPLPERFSAGRDVRG